MLTFNSPWLPLLSTPHTCKQTTLPIVSGGECGSGKKPMVPGKLLELFHLKAQDPGEAMDLGIYAKYLHLSLIAKAWFIFMCLTCPSMEG